MLRSWKKMAIIQCQVVSSRPSSVHELSKQFRGVYLINTKCMYIQYICTDILVVKVSALFSYFYQTIN